MAAAAARPDAGVAPSVVVAGLRHRFGHEDEGPAVLSDVDLDLMPGEIVIMTGPSGSGKTTLLTLIGALRSVQQGSVRVLGRELRGLHARSLVEVRRNIGFIFQAHNLFDALTARQNVRMALELHDAPNGAEMDRLAAEILDRVGLGHRIDYKPESLSGGQRQRVAVARALIGRPRLVLADEPTAALDEESGRAVVDLLRERAQADAATVLMVTHDNRILDVADRIVSMIDGRVASNILVRTAIEICEFLKRCPVFEHMTPGELTDVSQQMTSERIGPGEAFIREGEEGDSFYVVRSGEVEVVAREGDGERRVATGSAGDFFGEAALITGEPRNATVRSLGEVELYRLDKSAFDAAREASATFDEQLRSIFFQRR